MEQLKLAAQQRTDRGSGAARRLRRSDKIPAVMYGHGSTPVALTLDRLRFRTALNAAGPNAIITLDVDGTDHLTIVKDMQRDTIANRVTHVDFMLIALDERLVVDVPLHLIGEATLASRQGAVVQQQLMSLTVEAPAGVIPPSIEVDITELTIENPVRVGDLDLPDGMVSQLTDDTLVVIGQRSRASIAAGETDEDEGEEEGEGAEAEAAEAAEEE